LLIRPIKHDAATRANGASVLRPGCSGGHATDHYDIYQQQPKARLDRHRYAAWVFPKMNYGDNISFTSSKPSAETIGKKML
jgi:hypothetical protein